jgi:tetratricopeptide (TPR) repeat protein
MENGGLELQLQDNRITEMSAFTHEAARLIGARHYAAAQALLETELRQIPGNWNPKQEDDQALKITFWDREEFLAYSDHQRRHGELDKMIIWTGASYSHGWYLLALVASEQGQFDHGLRSIDAGLVLEQDHPMLWNEKGYLLGQLKRHQESFECYVQAALVREWTPKSQMGQALRGQGVQLIDLNRVEEAEIALRRSLDFEPDNENVQSELQYIEQLRDDRAEKSQEIPWFLHSHVNPPTDPTTVALLAMVEDLPFLQGPEVVGPENYTRIFDAFTMRGWPAFEVEFDCIVPRSRRDYADVKRDVLRSPAFSIKAHRNLTEAFLGNRTVDEIFDEMRRKRAQQALQ